MSFITMIMLCLVLAPFLPLGISVLKALIGWHGEIQSSPDRIIQ